MKKKIVSLFSAAVLFITLVCTSFVNVSAANEAVEVAVSTPTTAKPGDEITVTLDLATNPSGGLSGITVVLEFDKDIFEYLSAKKGTVFPSDPSGEGNYEVIYFGPQRNDANDSGKCKIAYTQFGIDDIYNTYTGTGSLATLKFKIKEDAVNKPCEFEFNSTETIAYGSDVKTDKYSVISTGSMSVNVSDGKSDDATLKSLAVSAGTLTPAFSADTENYTVTLPYGTASVPTVTATANDAKAAVVITQATSFETAVNKATVTVTSEKGTVKTYTVTFETNVGLSYLKVNGVSVPNFSADITVYKIEVPYAEWKANASKTYNITAETSDATITPAISKNDFALTNSDSDNNSSEDVTITYTADGKTTTYTITFTVLACPHTNKTVIDSVPADCTNDGYEDYECPDCGKTDRKTLASLGHDWSSEWTIDTPADCTNDGSKSHHCTRCGSKNDVTVISALGHKWGFWTQVGDTENYERICSVCNANETKTAQDISHDHIFNGTKEIITQPTCTTEGLQKVWCSVESCPEFVEEKINKIAHTEGTPIIDPVPTCNSVGISTVKCTVCGTTIRTSEIPMTDHSYGTSYESDANGHWQVCGVCGSKSEATAHTENNGIVTTPATSSTSGIKTYSCTVCGYEMRTEVIPATGNDSAIDYPTGGYTGAPVIPVGGTATETMTVKVENNLTGKTTKAIARKNGNSVSVKLGTENNGNYANVFTTDDEYIYSALIENGRASFSVPNDVKIKIVIDSIAYGEDVSSAAGDSYETAEISYGKMTTYLVSIIVLIGASVIMAIVFKNRVKK